MGGREWERMGGKEGGKERGREGELEGGKVIGGEGRETGREGGNDNEERGSMGRLGGRLT